MSKLTLHLKFNTGGLLELIVLKLLSHRTYSLEEIRTRLKEIGFRTPTGSLYPLFSRLRAKTWVRSGYEESESGDGMKTYELTQLGKIRLKDFYDDWKNLNSLIIRL